MNFFESLSLILNITFFHSDFAFERDIEYDDDDNDNNKILRMSHNHITF